MELCPFLMYLTAKCRHVEPVPRLCHISWHTIWFHCKDLRQGNPKKSRNSVYPQLYIYTHVYYILVYTV